MFVNNMFMFSGIVLITMHHLAGYQWNIIVHCYCVGVMTLWGLILMMFARLGYVFFSTNNMSYVNLNMHYVQLEVDWMMITAMHWYYHVINPDVAPPHMDREYVWKHVTMRKIKADLATQRLQVQGVSRALSANAVRSHNLQRARGASPRRRLPAIDIAGLESGE
jgi:hypothetical protein